MITFIILNYKNIKDTKECIKSIRNLKTDIQVSIVVVDNHSLSPDEFKQIKPLCDHLIKMDKNVGFALANNKGCSFAIQKYKPDFLVVINNDTVIEQPDFIEHIYQIYQETDFDVLGPKIETDRGESVNPFKAYETKEEVELQIKKANQLIFIYKHVFLRTLLRWYFKIKYFFKKPYHQENGKERQKDVSLHGCALIFSKKYYQKFKDIFYPGTFLYHEEEFLTYRRKKENLCFIYDPLLTIYHKEGASLNKSIQNNYQKLIFKEENRLKSLEKLKKVMDEDIHI